MMLHLTQELEPPANPARFIPVDVQDRIEGRQLGSITGWVIKRAQSEHRISQILDPDIRRMLPLVELFYFERDFLCQSALTKADRWLKESKIEPFPLEGCDSPICNCGYRTFSLRQAQRDRTERGIDK